MLDHKSPYIPQIDMSTAPKEEENNLYLLNSSLSAINQYVNQFQGDLHLFEYCAVQGSVFPDGGSPAFRSWQLVAARDAVMALWHYRNEMLAANTYANRSPYISPKLTKSAMAEANSKFEMYFADFADIRHAVAHTGEMAKNREAYEKNTFTGSLDAFGLKVENTKHLRIKDMLSDRHFVSTTFGGKVVNLEISRTTVMRMTEVRNLFYLAFKPTPPAKAPGPPATS
jgi:hypothetical protein